jgi:hypothetical protein
MKVKINMIALVVSTVIIMILMLGPMVEFLPINLQSRTPLIAMIWGVVLMAVMMGVLGFWTFIIGKTEVERIEKAYESAKISDSIPFLILILSILTLVILLLIFYPSSKIQLIVYAVSSLLLILGINFLEERLIRKYYVRSGVNDLRRE